MLETLTLAHLCQPGPPLVLAPESPLSLAVAQMGERRVSSVVIAAGDRPVGILTERDVLGLIAAGTYRADAPLSAVMSPDPLTADPQLAFVDGYALMAGHGVWHLVLTDADGRLYGVLSETDFAQALGAEELQGPRTVADLMTRDPVRVPPEAPVAVALALMAERHISSVIVAEGDRALGILSERDAIRLARSALDLGAIPIADCMSHPLRTIGPECFAYEAGPLMRAAGVRRLVVEDAEGRLLGILTRRDLLRDIKDVHLRLLRRTIAEQGQALRDARRQLEEHGLLRAIFDTSTAGIGLRDLDGRLVLANPALLAMLGYAGEPQALLGRRFTEALASADPGADDAECARLRAGEIESYRKERHYRHREGHTVVAEVSVSAIRNAVGEMTHSLVIVNDISDLRRAQERLLEAQALAHLGHWEFDPAQNRLSWSDELYRIFGLTPGTPIDPRLPFDRVHPEDRAFVVAVYRRSCARAEPFVVEHRVLRPDGRERWVQAGGVHHTNDAGVIIRSLGTVQDITGRKRRELELDQAQKAANAANQAKGAFLALMSHEIRTPLNAVLGLAQVLSREPLAPSQQDMIASIQDAGRSLLAILNDILDLSRIEAGQVRIDARPFSLETLLARLDRLMRHSANAKGLKLHITGLPGSAGALTGDALRLEQVLGNLLGNAIKFTAQGEVGLAVRVREATASAVRLRFEVRDTGIGIEPEVLPRLFAPFTQADEGITRRFGGTGLGLSLSKRLVELMGGEIGVKSRPGQGSVFWIELPLGFAAAEGETGTEAGASTAVPPVPVGPRLTGLHVLVVDDSAMNRDLMQRTLELEGATATLVGNGQQALGELGSRPHAFAAVLMDVRMPVMDGLTATRLIREQLGLVRLPIIALTAGVLAEQQAAARAAGVDAVLVKPVDLEQVVDTLYRWIGPGVRSAAAARPVGGVVAPRHPSVPIEPGAAGDWTDPVALWSSLPGIDGPRAVATLARDRAGFLRLLGAFRHEFADVVALTRRALDDGDRDAAAHRMHSLRGNADALAALDLMAAAGDLEAAIERGETELETRLSALADQLAALFAASRPWLDADAADGSGVPWSAPDAARLAELRDALENNALRAVTLLEALRPALIPVLGLAGTESLRNAVRGLRFTEALAILERSGWG